jgi:hypothetical protein
MEGNQPDAVWGEVEEKELQMNQGAHGARIRNQMLRLICGRRVAKTDRRCAKEIAPFLAGRAGPDSTLIEPKEVS